MNDLQFTVCESDDLHRELIATLQKIDTLLKGKLQRTKPILRTKKIADATGIFFPNSTRITHRVAGLSMLTPPPDPFRIKSNGGGTTVNDQHRGDNAGVRIRELQFVDQTGHETSVRIHTQGPIYFEPDPIDPEWRMRIQIGVILDALREYAPARRVELAERMVAYATSRTLVHAEENGIEFSKSTSISFILQSPFTPAKIITNGFRCDPTKIDGHVLAQQDMTGWPKAFQIKHTHRSDKDDWSVMPFIQKADKIHEMDAMLRLRLLNAGDPLDSPGA